LIACRQSSEIRAVCANERSYGSVRGAISNDRPYRDLFEAELVPIWWLVFNDGLLFNISVRGKRRATDQPALPLLLDP
jgi:hypothetical protein